MLIGVFFIAFNCVFFQEFAHKTHQHSDSGGHKYPCRGHLKMTSCTKREEGGHGGWVGGAMGGLGGEEMGEWDGGWCLRCHINLK